MTLQQMLAWVQAGQILVEAGVATVGTIRSWIKDHANEMTDDQLNEICDAIIAGAERHRQIAVGDAGEQNG